MKEVKRCAIYTRTSSTGANAGRQTVDNQLLPLRQYASTSGFKVVEEYIDNESGAKSDRQAFKRMFDDAARKKFDVLLIWSIDRFSREGVLATLTHLKKLKDAGVEYVSLQETYINSMNEWGDVLIAFIAKLAEMERRRIQERIRAGLTRARTQGKQLGRPKKIIRRDRIEELRASGKSIRQIAAEMKLSKMTVQRVVAELKTAA